MAGETHALQYNQPLPHPVRHDHFRVRRPRHPTWLSFHSTRAPS
jgi:hypothetical protein